MAKQQNHVYLSIVIALLYAFYGHFYAYYPFNIILLASVIVVVAGLLPNIDDSGSTPEREVAGLLAAISPLVLFEFYPEYRQGGVSQVTLIVVCSYIISRIVVEKLLQNFTVHRGMIHSVPAAIICFELVYLFFWDLKISQRLYVASAAFIGFMWHLVVDAYGNLDLIGKAMGRENKHPATLKLLSESWGTSVLLYGTIMTLGWFVLKDIYPDFRLFAGVKY